MNYLQDLTPTIQSILKWELNDERKRALQPLIHYIQQQLEKHDRVSLTFICTHNSRRSQFCQLWASVAAYHYKINVDSYSGGTEVTAFNEKAIESLRRSGFHIEHTGYENPVYSISFSKDLPPVEMYSKLYNDSSNPDSNFCAVMTCSDADENCPYVEGAEERIAVTYEDPKKYDETPLETEKYDERSRQIASELFYVFSKINEQ